MLTQVVLFTLPLTTSTTYDYYDLSTDLTYATNYLFHLPHQNSGCIQRDEQGGGWAGPAA